MRRGSCAPARIHAVQPFQSHPPSAKRPSTRRLPAGLHGHDLGCHDGSLQAGRRNQVKRPPRPWMPTQPSPSHARAPPSGWVNRPASWAKDARLCRRWIGVLTSLVSTISLAYSMITAA